MSDRFENTFPAFVVTHDAWYGDTALYGDTTAEVMVGFFTEDGGTAGEFALRWRRLRDCDEPVCQLQAFDDSWNALCRMPELMRFLRKWDREYNTPTPKPEDLITWLKMHGFRDITKYQSPFDEEEAA